MRVRRRNSLLRGLEAMRAAVPGLSTTDVILFLYVAENEGINMVELAAVSGMTMATVSRVIRSMAADADLGALPPYSGVLDIRPNPNLNTSRVLYLSAKGRRLCESLEEIIATASPIRTQAELQSSRPDPGVVSFAH